MVFFTACEQDAAEAASSETAVDRQPPDQSSRDWMTGQPLRHFGREIGGDHPRRTEGEEAGDARRLLGHDGDENAGDAAACILRSLRSDVPIETLVSATECGRS
jgi:hypothetical protein